MILIVGLQAFVGVSHVGQHLIARGFLLLLRLRDGESRARDFALIAVENRKLDLAEERSRAQSGDVRVVDLPGHVAFAVRFRSSYWLFAAVTPCCAARRSGRVASALTCKSSMFALSGW